ncbi:hypothetical protein [Peribacillus frigoritolerans]|uniref:Uncharacterized protein n=1 Tax=Peribacillus castrilensis TaxID=2897690 RepID=A0AAW9NJL5_9BACI|nr:hypothetical protein [Peribacillus castrilensis]
MYNESQKKALALHLQNKFMEGVKGYEIVVTLMALVKRKDLKESDVQPILMTVHFDNVEGVMRSLQKAHELLDEELIESILNDVKPRN